MSASTLSIEQQPLPEQQAQCLVLRGYLDAHTYEQLEAVVRATLAGGCRRLLFELSGIQYLSSAGAGVLIGAHYEALEQQGSVVLLQPTPHVREVLELLGLTQIFPVLDDRAAALLALSQAPRGIEI